jgi:hypothetical protein
MALLMALSEKSLSVLRTDFRKCTLSPMFGMLKQEDSDPIKYRRVLESTLLHAFAHDFTAFAECVGTDCK